MVCNVDCFNVQEKCKEVILSSKISIKLFHPGSSTCAMVARILHNKEIKLMQFSKKQIFHVFFTWLTTFATFLFSVRKR